jgi:HAE1 family hydrophobic/amphiphilic exporter-1
VLLFFLRSVRSTVVISLAIPISIIATFALIYFGGFTLNLMTLGGLALGVGMMVDSSIVVLENIYRRRNEEKDVPVDAAVIGTGEVGPAIVASTLTTLVIFLPLIFVRGVSGILFKELAYVIVFSLVCSLLVSLTIVPMLASKLLRSTDSASEPRNGGVRRLNRMAEQGFDRLDNGYRNLLQRVLRHRVATVLVSLGLLVLSFLLVPLIGTEFLPPSDEGEVRVTGEMEIGTRLGIVDSQTRRMEEIVYAAVPEAVATVATVGGTGWRPDSASQGEIQLSLKPAKERERSNTEIAEDLRKRLTGQIAGVTIRTRAPQGQFLLQRLLGGEQSLLIEIRGYELDTLELLADQARQLVEGLPGITDVELSRKAGVPQEAITVDREKAADLGISVRRVVEAIETAVAGSQAGEYRTQGDSYRILVKLKNAEQLSLDEILDLTLTSTEGRQVALRNLVATESTRGPILIDRKDQQRIVTVEANVAGRDLGSVAEDVQHRLHRIVRPVGYDIAVAGTYEEQQDAFRELVVSLVLALVLVYMVLACQYEALRDPIVVMVSVPLAAIGVFLILFLTGTTLNVQSYIGCIMLGGIVVNNAILLVDQSGQLRKIHGWTTRDAVAEAGRRRLRPILMTTLTTILGLVPLALGIGEGADAQAPLARVVIGGLTGSTLITLVLIPAIYSLVHPDRAPTSVPAPEKHPAPGGAAEAGPA